MSNAGGSANRRKGGAGKDGGGSGGTRWGQSPAPDSIAGVLNSMPKKTKDLHRTSFLMFLQRVMGVSVDLLMVDGRHFRGVLHTATPFHGKKFELALKGVTPLDTSGAAVEDPAVEVGSTVLLAFSDIKTLTVSRKNVADKEAEQNEFETDSSVGRRTDLRELEGRDLQSVANSWLAPETSTSLESGGNGRGGIGQWNQFEANKRLYNVQNTYDENLYTKKLDKNNLTKEQLKKADKVARAIETSMSNNIVLKEDRGQLEGEDFNEEDMFSGVVRPDAAQGQGKGKGESQQPGPQGAWKRGFNIAGAGGGSGAGNNSSSPGGSVGSDGGKGGKTAGSSGKSSPSGSGGGAWSSKAPKDSASALLASSVGVVSSANTNIKTTNTPPPGLDSSSPPPGLQPTDEEEPNISFYGSGEDRDADTASDKKTAAAKTDAKEKSDVEAKDVKNTAENKGKVEDTEGSDKTPAPPTTKLRADASEWKPNASAPAFVPGSAAPVATPTTPAEKKPPSPMGGKGKGKGNKGQRHNNNNNNHHNMHNNQHQGQQHMGAGVHYPHGGVQGYPHQVAYMTPMVGAGGVQSFAPQQQGGMYPHPQMMGQPMMMMQQQPGYYGPPVMNMQPGYRALQGGMYPGGPGGAAAGTEMYNTYGQMNTPVSIVPQLQQQPGQGQGQGQGQGKTEPAPQPAAQQESAEQKKE